MQIQRRLKVTSGIATSLVMFMSLGVSALAQETTVEGLVIGRDGPSMSVRTADSSRLTVLLSDSTKATEKGGFLGLDRKELGVTALVPGLSVKVEGSYDPDHRLVAKKVSFTRNSMNVAKQIDAGLNPANQQIAAAQDQLRSDRKDIDQSLAAANEQSRPILLDFSAAPA